MQYSNKSDRSGSHSAHAEEQRRAWKEAIDRQAFEDRDRRFKRILYMIATLIFIGAAASCLAGCRGSHDRSDTPDQSNPSDHAVLQPVRFGNREWFCGLLVGAVVEAPLTKGEAAAREGTLLPPPADVTCATGSPPLVARAEVPAVQVHVRTAPITFEDQLARIRAERLPKRQEFKCWPK